MPMSSNVFPLGERRGDVVRKPSGPEPGPDELISKLGDAGGPDRTARARLTGAQVGQFIEAILSGFGTDELEMLVRLNLDESLHNIASGGSFRMVVFRMIEWAEQHDRIEHLVLAVRRERPNNAAIRSIADSLFGAGRSGRRGRPGIKRAKDVPASATGREDVIPEKRSRPRRGENARRERMYALGTERLKAAVQALREIGRLDVRHQARLVRQIESILAGIAGSPDS
jgi:Effector-associated domain 1